MRQIYGIALFFWVISFSVKGQSGNQLLDFSTHIKVEKNKIIEEKWLEIQINNKESAWATDVEIAHGENDKFKLLEAVILDVGGDVVRKLKKKEIQTRNKNSDGAFYEDNVIASFSLKWNQYPYRIRYGYQKISDKYIYVARWFPVINTHIETKRASLKVEVPKDFGVAVDFTESFKYSTKQIDDVVIYEWEIRDQEPLDQKAFSPPLPEIIPSVSVVPKQFKYGEEGSFADWASFGQWLEKINDGLDELPEAEQAKVDLLLEGIEDTREKVAVLYHYMQDHTRYVNVAIDIGGLKPYPASYVCEKKYGDCKALTIYMKAMLQYAGIPAYYTTIYAGDNPPQIKKDLPSQQFNHVILAVPIEGDTLWLENTANYLPADYLGTFTQGRYGFLVDGENSRLVKTPTLQPEDVLENSAYDIHLDENGKGEAKVKLRLKGETFEKYSYLKHQGSERRQADQIKSDIALQQGEIKNWEIEQAVRDQEYLDICLDMTLKDQLRKVADILVIKPFTLVNIGEEDFKDRNHDIRIPYPIQKADTLTYHLPFLYRYKVDLPQEVLLEMDFGTYREQYYVDGDQVKVVRSFLLRNGNYEKTESEKFYGFFQAIEEAQHKSVIVLNQHYDEES